MIKISILKSEKDRIRALSSKVPFLWLKIDFRSEKERDVVWLDLRGQISVPLPTTPLADSGIVFTRTLYPDDRKCLCIQIQLWLKNPTDPSLFHTIVNSSVESCKQYIEGVLLDAAIKGDLNTKQEGL